MTFASIIVLINEVGPVGVVARIRRPLPRRAITMFGRAQQSLALL
jgi:hypothetical protein